ncbi:hypothetical protein [Paenibacillus sp. USHLN196]|uniref:hypothetical protein n=1 Tax=Paenibacillus sp. USHLN196 TaxID=3081291 RepID=UPI0030158DA3
MLGSDNIRDAWSPFGNGDMLQRASRMAERENWVSDNRLLGTYAWVSNGKLTPSIGDPADFMLVRALNAQHAIASVPARAAVFKIYVKIENMFTYEFTTKARSLMNGLHVY